MTHFLSMTLSPYSVIHSATFRSCKQEYQLQLQKVGEFNLHDSSLALPDNYVFSKSGCWEITFDLIDNIRNQTPFRSPPRDRICPVTVMRAVERTIFDHYTLFHAGMYLFAPENKTLETLYRRLLERRLGQGFTLEMGLEPQRRGYVLRTPRCYGKST